MLPNPQFPAGLVTFTEEILNQCIWSFFQKCFTVFAKTSKGLRHTPAKGFFHCLNLNQGLLENKTKILLY